MCSEEVTGSHSVFVWGVCGGVSGCTTGISGHKKSLGMCVVHWWLGSERDCVYVCVHVHRGVYAPEKGLSVPSLESAWQ